MQKVSVICVDCESDYIDDVLSAQTYQNIEVVATMTGKDFYQDIVEYCKSTDSDYICFLEPNQTLSPNKIQKMVEYAERAQDARVVFCNRNYIESDGTVVAHSDKAYQGVFKDVLFDGNQVLRVCMESGNNLLGNLSTMMVKRDGGNILSVDRLKQYRLEEAPQLQKAFLMFEFLEGQIMALEEEELVSTYVERTDTEEFWTRETLFREKAQIFLKMHHWEALRDIPAGIAREHRNLLRCMPVEPVNVEKKMTFFCTDKGEYYNLLPVMEEARRRGYEISYTDDLDVQAEIGIYCQHFGKPQNSKFSCVLLHDMVQGHNRWPNIWELERWNVYDIGIVPGKRWANRWARCAFQYYVNPRRGAYMLGYPKSNGCFSEELGKRVRELRKCMNLKYNISVLYAPSWENDEKEDDFVRALASLPINLIVKQASWPKAYGHIIKNIEDMREMHMGKYDNLYYIEPEESIMVALEMCDIVVSDESSVMIEALMFGKPSIAVRDWLIPDTIPSRFASIPFEDVYKCKKVELRETVEKMIAHGVEDTKVKEASDDFFANREYVTKDILDAIEYFTTGEGCTDFMKWKLSGCYMPANMWS